MADLSLTCKLCNASARGDLGEVLDMLHCGADVNGFNPFQRTALQVVKLSSVPVVEVLLEAGANPDLRDPACGVTITHDAAREGFHDTVRVLLERGADANIVDNRGNLPLHLAAKGGYLEAVQLLTPCTADPHACNGEGLSPAQIAHSHHKVVVAAWIDDYLSPN